MRKGSTSSLSANLPPGANRCAYPYRLKRLFWGEGWRSLAMAALRPEGTLGTAQSDVDGF